MRNKKITAERERLKKTIKKLKIRLNIKFKSLP